MISEWWHITYPYSTKIRNARQIQKILARKKFWNCQQNQKRITAGSLKDGQRKIAIVHFLCSCTICFAVVPCILQLCFFFCRCAKTMYYSYVQFCWCANEIAVLLCILQLYIQFVSCELFSQLYYIFPCIPPSPLPPFPLSILSREGYFFFSQNVQVRQIRILAFAFFDSKNTICK